jgi:hypothetical protein
MIPVQTIAGMRRGGIMQNGGGCELKSDIFDTLLELL